MRGSTSTPPRGSRAGTALLAIGALLVGCGGSNDSKPIVDVRPASQAEKPAPDGVTSADRFAQPGWRYDTPEGWTPLPAAEMRIAGFKVAGDANNGIVSADIFFPDLPPFTTFPVLSLPVQA